MIFRSLGFVILLVSLAATTLAETITVDVSITLIDTKRPSITVSYDGKSKQLELAKNLDVQIDGKKSDFTALIPGDTAQVTYDKDKQVITKIVVQREAMLPAEKLPEGWDEIDQRLIFLMVRLADVEATLDAIDQAIEGKNRLSNTKSTAAKRAERENEDMDRKGGGPLKWSQFYGTTAEKFFYHPTDRNSTYHTVTVLNQQGPQADNKVGGGVPSSQGLPVHQRPPQFDYIYRSNERAKARAEAEAYELRGKIDQLVARRQRLEAEQAGLWVEIAFRAIAHYDLDKKPLYRFEPLLVETDTISRQRADSMRAAIEFMAVALSIIADTEREQAGTFLRIKPTIAKARQSLSDTYIKMAVDVTDKQSSIGRLYALAKRLDDIAANLTDSYSVSMEGDSAKDKERKETFRVQLQQSLLGYAQIILAMDEMVSQMKYEYGYQPDTEKPIKLVNYGATKPMIQEMEKNPLKFLLFNGKNLDGWEYLPLEWSKSKTLTSWFVDTDRSVLVCDGTDRNELATTREFLDFRLSLQWRWLPNGKGTPNGSGVVIRSRGLDKKGGNPAGIEVDLRRQFGISSDGANRNVGPGTLIGYERSLRSATESADGFTNRVIGFMRTPAVKPEGEWNTCEILCENDTLRVTINGTLTNEAFGLEEKPGKIVLRNQSSEIEFRKIEISVP